MKTLYTKLIVLLLFAICGLGLGQASAQTPGLIFQPAINGGQKILDPNGDGYVSKTTAGFPGINKDEGAEYSEIPYRPFPVFMNEPLHDILTGNSGGHTDFAPRTYVDGKPTGSPLASYFDGTNFMFRVRLGGTSSASMAYSILIDTDGKFPGGTPNPGFEFEVVFANNFDVRIYDHRTNKTGGDIIFQGSYKQYSHKAVAASMGDNNPDYFYDFYVPLTAFKGGITTSTPLRMSGVTVTSAKSGIYGSISDVGGVDNRQYNGDIPSAWEDIINAFPPTSLTDIQAGDFPPAVSTPPIVNGPIFTNSTTITGTSVEAPGSVITVYQNGVAIGTAIVQSNGSWSLPVPTGVTLLVGDVISATVSPEGKTVSGLSNKVIVQQGSCVETLSPPITSIITQSPKGFAGTTSYLGWQTFTIYRTAPDGVVSWEKYTVEVLPSHAVSGSSPTVYNWFYQYPSTKDIAAGLYRVTVTPSGMCESMSSNEVCYDGTGNTTINNRVPTITAINGVSQPTTTRLFLMPLTSVSGTLASAVTDTKLVLYKNGIQLPSFTTLTSTTNWTINTSGINLVEGDVITVRTVLNANSNKISVCGELSSIPSNYKIAALRTATPVITGSYCGTTSTITGKSTEDAGTRIRLYVNGVLVSSPSAPHAYVNVQGYWTASNLSIPVGAVVTATAVADDKIESAQSAPITVTTQQTITGYSLNSPVYENDIAVSGKAPSGTVSGKVIIRLYIDGAATSYTTSIFAANGDWTISDIFAYDIYAGAKLSVRVSSDGNCESISSNTVTVECKPSDRAITATLSPSSYCYNTAGIVNLSSSTPNAAYTLYINGVQSGSSVAGTGFPISLNTGPLTVNPSNITIKEVRIGSICSGREFGPLTATVYNAIPNSYTLSASPDAGCPNLKTTITIHNARKGYSYQLINATTKAFVGTALTPDDAMIPGETGNISFAPITVPTTTTFGLLITDTATGCSTVNTNTVTITISGPDVTRSITASRPVCEGSATTISIDTQAGYTYSVFFKDTNQQVGSDITGDNTVKSVTTGPLTPVGVYTFYVIVTGGGCSTNMLTEPQTNVIDSGTLEVSAGNAQKVCRGTATTASAALSGSDPSPGTGTWTVTTKPANAPEPVFSNINDRYATVSNLVSGDYVFTWSVVTPCGSGSGSVTITVNCHAVYAVVGPNYWDMFPNGSNLATAYDEDKGVVSAVLVGGRIPRGSVLNSQGHVVVDFSRGDLEPGNFTFTIITTDFFGHTTETPLSLTIYPRGTAPVPMPVVIIGFDVTAGNGEVLVKWQTATENNSDRFEVKRSIDGKNFETIATVKAKGNSNQKTDYKFTDKSPLAGTSYYMLKQIDLDETAAFSQIKHVTNKALVANNAQVQAFPNPFTEELKVSIYTTKAGSGTMKLIDMQGRTLYVGEINIEAGASTFSIPVNSLNPGMYVIRISGKDISHTTKVVKAN